MTDRPAARSSSRSRPHLQARRPRGRAGSFRSRCDEHSGGVDEPPGGPRPARVRSDGSPDRHLPRGAFAPADRGVEGDQVHERGDFGRQANYTRKVMVEGKGFVRRASLSPEIFVIPLAQNRAARCIPRHPAPQLFRAPWLGTPYRLALRGRVCAAAGKI